jgi:hypothetical protein
MATSTLTSTNLNADFMWTACDEQTEEPDSQAAQEENCYTSKREEVRQLSVQGKFTRKSLQNCKVENNLAKLEGLLKATKSAQKTNILEGLIYVLRQLLAKNGDSGKVIGFLPFEEAYHLYCGFMKTEPDEARFRDHLLDKDFGLCVYITTIYNHRYIVLQNDTTDIGSFLKELERKLEDEESNARLSSGRYFLDGKSLSKIIATMDTEYDRIALKAVLFSIHSRAETDKLGIKPERAGTFLSKVLMASEESDRALKAAEDIFQLRTRERIEKIQTKVDAIGKKIERQKHFLSEREQLILKKKVPHLMNDWIN